MTTLQNQKPADNITTAAEMTNTRQLREIARIHRLNQLTAWERIERNLPGFGDFRLTPVNAEFSRKFDTDSFSEYKLSGQSSDTSKFNLPEYVNRIPNFWYGEICPESGIGFGYLRSGTLVPYAESNPERRQAATQKRTEELLQAALAISNGQQGKLRLINIDLQSAMGEVDGSSVETYTVSEQAQALSSFRGRSYGAPLVDYVEIDVQTVNTTVGEEKYHSAEGWQMTPKAQRQLLRLVSESLRSLHEETLRQVMPFAKEVRDLLLKEKGNEDPVKRYGLLARVALLASLGGAVVHFNCRSGKDRTGYLDAELKFLAYQLNQRRNNLPISAIGAEMLPVEKKAWKFILLESGNREIQKLNTGHCGSKLDRGMLKSRVGEDIWAKFVGNGRMART